MVNFGPLAAVIVSLVRVSRLGSVTARHSSSGRQPNFAALNRGRHLYSAGQPSSWALAHISSLPCSTRAIHRGQLSYELKRCQVSHKVQQRHSRETGSYFDFIVIVNLLWSVTLMAG